MKKTVYLDNYLMPRAFKGDALHLAYAAFCNTEADHVDE